MQKEKEESDTALPIKDAASDELKCNYSSCTNRDLQIKCAFCGKLFCGRHKIPHPAWQPISSYIPENVHPCPNCPSCPYCAEKSKFHPHPYESPYSVEGGNKPLPKIKKAKKDGLNVEGLVKNQVTEVGQKEEEETDGHFKTEVIKQKEPPNIPIIAEVSKKNRQESKKASKNQKNFVKGQDDKNSIINQKEQTKSLTVLEQKDTQRALVALNDDVLQVMKDSQVEQKKAAKSESQQKKAESLKVTKIKIKGLQKGFETSEAGTKEKEIKQKKLPQSPTVTKTGQPIQQEDGKNQNTKKDKDVKSDGIAKLKIALIAVAVLLILFAVVKIVKLGGNPENDPSISYQKKFISESVPVKNSFSEYTNPRSRIDMTNLTLAGFLRDKSKGTVDASARDLYMVDDYNVEIRLSGVPQEYLKFFVMNQTTREIYNVSGVFTRNPKKSRLDVSSIVLTERQMQIIEKEVIA